MEISAQILALVCLAFFAALSVRYFTHMFQLNSYTEKVQLGWMQKNILRVVPCMAIAAVAIVCAFFQARNFAYAYLWLGLFALVLSLLYYPRKAKKPLVYTARVKRLLVTYALLTLLVGALAVLLGGTGTFVLLGLAAAATPFTLLLANIVNAPIEKAVRNYYINDAKKMLASHKRLSIIGITGSFGKTSVKYYLTTLLGAKYNVLMTPESYNTPMGVVKTIRSSLRAKYVGDIKELCDIVHPEHGMVTSIGEQHLESFGSVENIIKTKYELADALPNSGKLYVNISSDTVNKHRPDREAVTYGLFPDADYYATDITVSSMGTTFTVCHGEERQQYTTKLIGEANVVNIVGAIAAANDAYGIPLAALKSAVTSLKCVPHRMELLDRGSMILIDDAFNSNPSGSRAALDVLSAFDGVRIMITPGMVELGDKEEQYNREFGEYAADKCDYVLLVGHRITKSIAEGLKNRNYPDDRCYTFSKVTEAIAYANSLEAGKKKYVLLENDLPDNY